MDPSDSSQNRRKIPAVSDVVEGLTKRLLATPEQQPMLFRAAQQVCAEELRLVRTGFRSAPFDELVERAIRLLPSELAREPSPRAAEGGAFPEPEPFDTIAAPPRAGKGAGEGPFALDSGDGLESYESPVRPTKAPSGPARPLEISETPAPPSSPAPAYRSYLREPRKERSSITGARVLIFLLLVGIGFGAYRIARTGYWPFRKAASPAPKRAAPARAPEPSRTEGTSPATTMPSSAAAPPAVPPAPPPREKTEPAPRSAAKAPASAAPAPAAGRTISSAPGRAAPPASATSAAPSPAVVPGGSGIPESRGSSMISPDWNGHSPVYMIHFSSYQRRENADRDHARLSKAVGGSFHVIEVNLGREGSWFRVMLGDFASRDEALAFRQRLAERGTPDMGLVYKVSGAR